MRTQKQIDEYLEWKASYAPTAFKVYRVYIERFATFIGRKVVDEITLGDVVRFQAEEAKRFSKSTVAFEVMIVRNYFHYWIRQGARCLDPSMIRTPRSVPQSHEATTESEYELLLLAAGESGFTQLTKKLCIAFLWDTGVRVSELCDIKICDIDMQERNARVLSKKSLITRWVFWTEETHQLMVKYLGTRLCLNQDPAFIISTGTRSKEKINPRTIQRWITELSKSAGITRRLSPHSFRHAKAHQILKRGGTVADIAKILGHSDRNPVAAFNYLKLSRAEIEDRAKLYL